MVKTKQKTLFLFLIIFSVYCALTIGKSWDEGFLINQGKIVINYLLSLGKIDDDIFRREYYSPIYYSLKFLFIQIFPIKYQIEASHLINLIFSIGTVVGIKKLSMYHTENINEKTNHNTTMASRLLRRERQAQV